MIVKYFVLLLQLCSALKLTVYETDDDYRNNKTTENLSRYPFSYGRNNSLYIRVYVTNLQLNVTVDLEYSSQKSSHPVQHNNTKLEIDIYNISDRHEKDFTISGSVETDLLMYVKLCSRQRCKGCCLTKWIAEGKLSTAVNYTTDSCSEKNACYIVVDSQNETSDYITQLKQPAVSTTTKPYKVKNDGKACEGLTQNPVLLYIIPSVIVACITILVVVIALKKYLRLNSRQLDTTPKQVLYAELDLKTVNQPARIIEDSPYAVVIGELRP